MSKYVTSVGSSTAVLIHDTPNIIQQSLLNSIQRGTNIASDLMNTLTNTYGQKVRQAYEYAKTDYVYGLPEGTLGQLTPNLNNVRTVLDTFVVTPEGGSYEILSAQISPLILVQFANETFVDDPKTPYDYHTNKVKNVTLRHKYDDTDYIVGDFPITSVQIYRGQFLCKFVYSHHVDDGEGILFRKQYTATMLRPMIHPNYVYSDSPHEHYYYVAYQLKDSNDKNVGLPKLWNYWENSDDYPILNLDDHVLDANQYMPVIPIRINNNMLYDTDTEKDTEAYRTSKILLNQLNLNIDELTEGVKSNPDIAQVDHAYITIGVNVFTDKQEALTYLYEFVKYMHTAGGSLGNTISIHDETYYVRLKWDKTEFTEHAGTIGKIGTVLKNIVLGDTGIGYHRPHMLYLSTQVGVDKIHTYSVSNLELYNYIYSTSLNVMTDLSAVDDKQEALCVPLNISLVESKLSPLQANTVYYDGLRIVFNAFDRTKLKWYQTGLFKFITMVVAVAISVITVNPTAMILAMGLNIAIGVLLPLIYKFTMKVFGDEVGAILNTIGTIVVIAVAAVYGYLPDIGSIINTAVMAGTQIAGAYLGAQMEDLQSEIKEFHEDAELQNKQLELAQQKLETNAILDPLSIYTDVGMVPKEPIDSFIPTRIDIPTIYGEQSVESVYRWVDMQLTLPTY